MACSIVLYTVRRYLSYLSARMNYEVVRMTFARNNTDPRYCSFITITYSSFGSCCSIVV